MVESTVRKFFKENRFYILGGIIILILFSLRFLNLTIIPVFADEAIYIRWAQVMKAEETLRFLPLSDGKEPLFMWVMMAFLKVIKDPLFGGRLLSVFSGLGTLIGTAYLTFLLFKSKKAALTAALIYALIPFTFFFDRMALVDSMLACFGVWTFVLSYLAFTKERLDFALLAGFALGGAWLTKSPALFFALLLPSLWLFIRSPKSLTKVIPLTLVTWVLGYGMFNILRLGPNYQLIASRNLDYVYPLSHFLTSPFDPLKPYLMQSWQWLVFMGPWPLIVLAFGGFLAVGKKNWKELLVLSAWFLGPIFTESEFAKVLTARYILFTIPFLIIMASVSVLSFNKKFVNIIYVILAALVFLSLKFDYILLTNPGQANLPMSEKSGYLEEWTAGQGIKEASLYIRNEQSAHPAEKILIGTEGYFGTLPDGLEIYLNDLRQITIIGVGLNFNKVPDQLVNSKKAGNKTYLLINDERFKGDAAKLGLRLLASYPKVVRPTGTHQSLLFFELTDTVK